MKSMPVFVLAVFLILGAVVCVAGCVDIPDDAVIGDWTCSENGTVSVLSFAGDGTGDYFVYAETSNDGEYALLVMTEFTWKSAGSSGFAMTFDDGTAETCSVDMNRGILTCDGRQYQLNPNPSSGWSIIGPDGKVISA